MKPMPVLVAVLALVPLSEVQASLGSPARQEAAPLRVDGPAAPAQGAATENAGQRTERRSRMVEATLDDRPVMRFSAMYREVGPKPATKDNCLQGTGSRLKRESQASSCQGHGQIFVPPDR
ncbi:hypothetical protein [Pseudoxanthomonas kaohsiungensis]|uniref:DUF3617 family protein n=1 Tax=Pseudoxanthomonas kaohsiungensis TaxID=283923 RepID=A0ABW3LZ92_9GAMM|nr:hypothetical protein [Pseudoxanthomonas kaohsiungensis]